MDGSWVDRLRPHLARVSTPGQYLGGEMGQIRKPPESVDHRWALLFPDTYSIGMSNLGFKIVYALLNGIEGVAAERCFAPWTDMEERMRSAGIPLLTLESHTPVRDFDVVGFSLQYELCYTNVLAMLDLAGIPLRASDRSETDPIVIGGGLNAFHPEPVADYFDLFLLGDGEVAIPWLVAVLRGRGGGRRELILEAARRVPGIYAPGLYEVRYHDDGRIAAVAPTLDGVPDRVEPARLGDLDEAPFPVRPPVPYVRVAQDRIAIEVMRGCTQGCRFCQAGMVKRPVRLRSVENVLRLARESYRNTGYDEISLLSLSTADYPFLEELMTALDREFSIHRVGLALPSLRVNQTLRIIPRLAGRVRRSSLTVAPEVGTDRLRDVIDKDIRNEDLYAGIREIYRAGRKTVKLYFMIGLPTEREEDVLAIADMGLRVSGLAREVGAGPGQVTLSVGNFVPKPHTPFQWEPMDREGVLVRKRELLYDATRGNRKLRLKVHGTGPSLMEGLLSRGDRRLGRLLLRLFREGARFDAWDEGFDRELWDRALRAETVDLAHHLHRPRDEDEILPWDHLGAPVSRAYLREEWERSREAARTPDCMDGRCNHCGLDVKECASALRAHRAARDDSKPDGEGQSAG